MADMNVTAADWQRVVAFWIRDDARIKAICKLCEEIAEDPE